MPKFMYIGEAAAPSSYTFTVDAGAYAVTGTDVAFRGAFYALAYKTGDQAAGAGAITFQAEVSDIRGVHDIVSQTEQFVVPAAWNGRYVRMLGNVECENGTANVEASVKIQKNGADYIGMGWIETENILFGYANVKGAPVPAVTGDYYEFRTNQASPNFVAQSEATWGQMQLLPSGFQGCLAYKTSSQALSAGVETAITWQAEVYDTDGFHDNAVDTSRVTIPSGVTLVRLYGNLASGNSTGQFNLYMWKNGAVANGLPLYESDTSGADYCSIASAPLAVTMGDYIAIMSFHASATTIPANNECWFAIEVLDPALKYALVNRITSNFDLGISTWTPVQFNNELVDTSGWFTVASPTIFTIPSGVTKVQVTFSLQSTSATSDLIARVLKNGAVVQGMAASITDTVANDGISGMSAILNVVPGDTISIEAQHGNGGDILVGTSTWFAINEVVDISA